MRFCEVSLRNWRNFLNVTFTIDDRLFVVGANASGKSNLLDVFRFLKDLTTDGLGKSVASRGGIKKIRNLCARRPSYIEICIKLYDEEARDEWVYQLQFNQAGGKNIENVVIINQEIAMCNGEYLINRKNNDSPESFFARQFTHIEQPAINPKLEKLYRTFQNMAYVNIIPQLIRESESFTPSGSYEDFYGRNLLENISNTGERERAKRLRIIAKVVQLAVPQLESLEFVNDSKGRPHLRILYKHFRPYGAYQDEAQLSDGTLRLIGIIWAIMDGDGLLLLEEPELYLHNEIVRQLPMFIANAQRQKSGVRRQVIISSHSYDILDTDTINANEVLVLEPDKEATTISKASDIESIQQKLNAGFSPAEAIIPHVTPSTIREGQLSIFDIYQ